MMSASDLPAGTLVGGDFRVVETLARGGMGVVYVAEQESTRKRRALKVMFPQPGDLDSLRKRFEQEAWVSSQIESDHVVQVIGAGIDAATTMPWIAMEMLEGEDLESRLTHGPLDWTDTWNVVGELCHALDAAHKLGLIHRDLKPSNVYLAKSRRPGVDRVVKVLDFGIAKRMSDAGKTTGALGTPLYMAPEQTATGSSFSPATDVWALGLLVFETMVGVPYWKAASQDGAMAALLREVVLEPIPPASERAAFFGKAERLPPRFDAWFARCVVRDPKARFTDAGEAYAALARMFAQVTGLNERVIPPPSSRLPPAPHLVGDALPASLPSVALQARTQPVFERSTHPVPPRSRAGVLVAGIAGGVTVVALVLSFLFFSSIAGPKTSNSASPARDPGPDPVPTSSATSSSSDVVPSAPPPEVVPSASVVPRPTLAPSTVTPTARPGPSPAPQEPKTSAPADPTVYRPPPAPPSKPPPPPPDPVIL